MSAWGDAKFLLLAGLAILAMVAGAVVVPLYAEHQRERCAQAEVTAGLGGPDVPPECGGRR